MWRFFYPQLQGAFPAQFGDVDLETYYGAINKVEPSFIRVEADEATYNMHIILRFELEQEILSGELPLEDLPEAWNSRMAEYLGVEVPDDTRGVLQDIHWSGGAFGYFPTYSLGNVISVQLWDKARGELPDLDAQFEQGEFGDLSGWLRENLHRHGRKYTSKEMLERITGGGMDPGPYVRYLKSKRLIARFLGVELGLRALGQLTRSTRVLERTLALSTPLVALSLRRFPLRHRRPPAAVRCSPASPRCRLR
jgi:carboxypeptidase Taq